MILKKQSYEYEQQHQYTERSAPYAEGVGERMWRGYAHLQRNNRTAALP